MEITKSGSILQVRGISPFSLDEIFDCGQAFRYKKLEDGRYINVAFNKVIELNYKDGVLYIEGADEKDFYDIWRNYFDLESDYAAIQKELLNDQVLRDVIPFGSGIRILRQDMWETLITFIISQQNNIPRIKGIIERLCGMLGGEIYFKGEKYRAFPTPEAILQAGLGGLEGIRCGFRSAYILDAASKVASGDIDLNEIKDLSTDEARKKLLTIKGVGPKVCDCVLLFGAYKTDAFPVDVWMDRALQFYYGKGKKFDPSVFGKYSGIAQQYLFYYARENKIGK